jgi:AcrR family transcriptional regulator
MVKREIEGLSREVVIAAARRLLEHSGEEGLSFRGVARDLGVTAPALYAYVEDKQELLAALATEHFAKLAHRFQAVDTSLDPLDRIRLLSRAYLDHALESPALFHLMFRYPPTPTAGVDAFPPATQAFDVAAAAAADAIALGELRVTDPQLVNMTMWAAMHGVAEVLLMGFDADAAYAETLTASVIDTMIAGLVAPGSTTRR